MLQNTEWIESPSSMTLQQANSVKKRKSNYPSSYWWMCIGALLFFLAFHIIIPELYVHLKEMNRLDLQGWIIGGFALSSLLARPLSGWLCDTKGRRITMLVGILCCIAASFGYIWASVPFLLIGLRVLHGLSAGFAPTGFAAFTADVVPIDMRGRAMGWQGMFSNIGAAVGFGTGVWFTQLLGRDGLYLFSGILGILALACFYILPESKPKSEEKNVFEFKFSKLIYYPSLQPFVVMLLICVPYGILIPAIKDYSNSIHINNSGLFFLVSISSSLLIRIGSGMIIDKIGRIWGVIIGTFFQFAGMLLLYFDKDGNLFFIAASCYGIGQGFTSPSLFAWAGDLGKILHRGRSLSTLFIALELGIVLGGVVVSETTNLNVAYLNFNLLFPICFTFTGFAFLFSVWCQWKASRNLKNFQ